MASWHEISERSARRTALATTVIAGLACVIAIAATVIELVRL